MNCDEWRKMTVGDGRDVRIRPAATVIVLRREEGRPPSILMGMRSNSAAFMPSKYVFPGGAVDPIDEQHDSSSACSSAKLDGAIAACARRELAEETGLALSHSAALPLIFRAITPLGRPRRFDAYFLLADAVDIEGDPDDFSRACDELSDLHWPTLEGAAGLDLPFITQVVLAEVTALVAAAAGGAIRPEATVPFFDNSGPEPRFKGLNVNPIFTRIGNVD